jgi:hypothetical protein
MGIEYEKYIIYGYRHINATWHMQSLKKIFTLAHLALLTMFEPWCDNTWLVKDWWNSA